MNTIVLLENINRFDLNSVSSAVADFNSKEIRLGEFNPGDDGPLINIRNVSHVIERIWIEDDSILGEIDILDTPSGKLLSSNWGHDGCRGSLRVWMNGDEMVEIITFDFITI